MNENPKEENPKEHPAWPEFVAWFEEHPEYGHPGSEYYTIETFFAGYNTGHNAGFYQGKNSIRDIIRNDLELIQLVQDYPDFFAVTLGESCLDAAVRKLRKLIEEENENANS